MWQMFSQIRSDRQPPSQSQPRNSGYENMRSRLSSPYYTDREMNM